MAFLTKSIVMIVGSVYVSVSVASRIQLARGEVGNGHRAMGIPALL